MVGLQVLHPQVRVVSWSWRRGIDEVIEREFDYSLEEQPIYLNSPIVELRQGTPLIRRRLVGPTRGSITPSCTTFSPRASPTTSPCRSA
jgi:hypothetical protein